MLLVLVTNEATQFSSTSYVIFYDEGVQLLELLLCSRLGKDISLAKSPPGNDIHESFRSSIEYLYRVWAEHSSCCAIRHQLEYEQCTPQAAVPRTLARHIFPIVIHTNRFRIENYC